jgi:hypothetical protein
MLLSGSYSIAAFLYLASTNLFLCSLSPAGQVPRFPSTAFSLLSSVAYVLACLSKAVAITLPFTLLCIHFYFSLIANPNSKDSLSQLVAVALHSLRAVSYHFISCLLLIAIMISSNQTGVGEDVLSLTLYEKVDNTQALSLSNPLFCNFI